MLRKYYYNFIRFRIQVMLSAQIYSALVSAGMCRYRKHLNIRMQ